PDRSGRKIQEPPAPDHTRRRRTRPCSPTPDHTQQRRTRPCATAPDHARRCRTRPCATGPSPALRSAGPCPQRLLPQNGCRAGASLTSPSFSCPAHRLARPLPEGFAEVRQCGMPKIIGGSLEEHRERTRVKIFSALDKLLETQDFESITFSAIAGAAEVGRTA